SMFEEGKFGQQARQASLAAQYAEQGDFDRATLRTPRYSGSETRYYVYAEQNLVAVLDGDGEPIDEYVNGPGTNQRLAVRRGGQTFEYVLDHRGTALAVLERDGDIAHAYKQVGTWGEFED